VRVWVILLLCWQRKRRRIRAGRCCTEGVTVCMCNHMGLMLYVAASTEHKMSRCLLLLFLQDCVLARDTRYYRSRRRSIHNGCLDSLVQIIKTLAGSRNRLSNAR
jgi:hypothetical protein